MGQDRAATHSRLTELWKHPEVRRLSITAKKYIILSDLHLGDKGKADDFRDNESALLRALAHYNDEGYLLILLGDVEEFWQFDLIAIEKAYGHTVYNAIRAFGPDRVIRLYGNHDSEWGAMVDPATGLEVHAAPEAVKLVDNSNRPRVLLVHGHQGSTESDKNGWMSRFFVRIYKVVEPLVKIDRHPSATKSQIADDYERIFHEWGKRNKVVVICGHSHRAIFASVSYAEKLLIEVRELQREISGSSGDKKKIGKLLKELQKKWSDYLEETARGRRIEPTEVNPPSFGWYYNSGCCLYSDGLTGLELENGEIRLVKWHRKVKADERVTVLDKRPLL